MKINLSDVGWKLQLPEDSGVYRYFNLDDELLYVGKAINLKKRVLSYFQKSYALSPRIAHMVSKINYIEVTVTENEASALLLENNFIKNLNPRYNILFVDDKSYPYIKIKHHDFPVLEYYRGKVNPQDNFFGPYPNSYAVKQFIELLQKIFQLRTCSDSEFNNRSRPCMLYQIKRCSAPCVKHIDKISYNANIDNAKKFLRGEYSSLVRELSQQMTNFAENMEYEQAAMLRDQITSIKNLNDKQIVSTTDFAFSCDLILVAKVANKVYFYIIYVKNGLYIGDNSYIINYEFDLNDSVECFIEEFYCNTTKVNLYINHKLNHDFIEFMQLNYQIKISELIKKQNNLVEMGYANLAKVIEQDSSQNVYFNAIEELKKILNLTNINRVECYDISHHNGAETVGAMTVFQDGLINSSLYRRYNLQDTNGDDLKALSIVLKRRLLNTELPLPQVLLVDGGFGQLNAVKNIVNQFDFCDKIVVIAIFKGEKRKELNDSVIVNEQCIISYTDSPLIFKLLQPLRDEAHRFSITAHRNKKIKSMTKTKLSNIPSVGVKKRKMLLAYFGDVDSISKASIVELMKVDGIGYDTAKLISQFFNNSI